jgi:hypothetical protein
MPDNQRQGGETSRCESEVFELVAIRDSSCDEPAHERPNWKRTSGGKDSVSDLREPTALTLVRALEDRHKQVIAHCECREETSYACDDRWSTAAIEFHGSTVPSETIRKLSLFGAITHRVFAMSGPSSSCALGAGVSGTPGPAGAAWSRSQAAWAARSSSSPAFSFSNASSGESAN